MESKDIIKLLEAVTSRASQDYEDEILSAESVRELSDEVSRVYCQVLGITDSMNLIEMTTILEKLSLYIGHKVNDLLMCGHCRRILGEEDVRIIKVERKEFKVCKSCYSKSVSDLTGELMVKVVNDELQFLDFYTIGVIKDGKIERKYFEYERRTDQQALKDAFSVDAQLACKSCGSPMFFDSSKEISIEGLSCPVCQERLRGQFVPVELDNSNVSYKNMPFTRQYGIELESKVPMAPNKPIVTIPFVITNDGSISGEEYVSEILQGDTGLKGIKDFVSSVGNRDGAYQSAGFHLHLGVEKSEINVYNIKKIFAVYGAFEDGIFSMLPPSRRGNRYCKDLDALLSNHTEVIKSVSRLLDFTGNLKELQKQLYRSDNDSGLDASIASKYNDLRYGWINVHSIFFRGTVEIRNHSATFNYKKIYSWILLHQFILDYALRISLPEAKKLYLDSTRNPAKQLETLFSLFPEDKMYKDLKQYIKSRAKLFKVQSEFTEDKEYEQDGDKNGE